MKKVLLILLAAALTAVTLISCTKEEKSGGTASCTMVFDPNGGKIDGNDYFITTVKPGEKVAEPNDPVLEGGTFLGWFTADSTKWNFDTPVTANMTLYAHWYIPDPRTVYFLANGGEFETETESKDTLIRVVMFNTAVSKPSVTPVREGYSFTGWFTADSTEWDFNTLITRDTTLYAGWQSDSCTVYFVANGGKIEGKDTLAVRVKIDSVVAKPSNPTADSVFLGWYVDTLENIPWNFNTPVTRDTTLYAEWQSAAIDADRMMIIKFRVRETGMEDEYIFKYKSSSNKLSTITVKDETYALDYYTSSSQHSKDSVRIYKGSTKGTIIGSIKSFGSRSGYSASSWNQAATFNVWSKGAKFNLKYQSGSGSVSKYLSSLDYVEGSTYSIVKNVAVSRPSGASGTTYRYDSLSTNFTDPGAKIEFVYTDEEHASKIKNENSSHVFSPTFFVYAFLKNEWKTQNPEEAALAMAIFNTDFFEQYDYYIPVAVNITRDGAPTLSLGVEYASGPVGKSAIFTSIDIDLPEASSYSKAAFYEITTK